MQYVLDSVCERGRPPTLCEIGQQMGFNAHVGAVVHLKALERKGRIRLPGNRACGIELVGMRFTPVAA